MEDFVFNNKLTVDEMKHKMLDSRIVYLDKWHHYLISGNALIPTDTILWNEKITFNQAVFLLLGLYADNLDTALPDGEFFKETSSSSTNELNEEISKTHEYKQARIQFYSKDKGVNMSELLEWAENQSFFIKRKPSEKYWGKIKRYIIKNQEKISLSIFGVVIVAVFGVILSFL